MISTQIVTPAAALASQERGSATGQGVRRMLVKLLSVVARETPRGGSPTSFQGSIGAWPTMSSRSVGSMSLRTARAAVRDNVPGADQRLIDALKASMVH